MRGEVQRGATIMTLVNRNFPRGSRNILIPYALLTLAMVSNETR
jgi:hypothetical protein